MKHHTHHDINDIRVIGDIDGTAFNHRHGPGGRGRPLRGPGPRHGGPRGDGPPEEARWPGGGRHGGSHGDGSRGEGPSEEGRRHGGGRRAGRGWGLGGDWADLGMDARGRGRRGPGRGQRGDVRNAILALLQEDPMNGYQVIKAVEERSEGLWRPGAGSVYPALGLLEDEGLIEPGEPTSGNRKVFVLTEAGREYVAEHADELISPWDKVAGPHEASLDVRRELGQLGMAVQQAVLGDPEQTAKVKKVVAEARRAIYRILADDETPPTDR